MLPTWCCHLATVSFLHIVSVNVSDVAGESHDLGLAECQRAGRCLFGEITHRALAGSSGAVGCWDRLVFWMKHVFGKCGNYEVFGNSV